MGTPGCSPGFFAIWSAAVRREPWAAVKSVTSCGPGAGIADDGDGIGRGQPIGDDGQALVDLVHNVGGQGGIDDEGNGEGIGVVTEPDDALLDAILIDFEAPPGQTGDEVAVLVLDGDGDFDDGDAGAVVGTGSWLAGPVSGGACWMASGGGACCGAGAPTGRNWSGGRHAGRRALLVGRCAFAGSDLVLQIREG